MTKLYIYLKEGDAFQFYLTEEKISVGRSSDNDILLPDPYCSGHHGLSMTKKFLPNINKE